MSITDRLDLSTPEKAKKALFDLHAEQKRLKKANRDLSENLDKKSADLTQIQQRMSEMQNAAPRNVSSNSSLNKYQRQDGSVRLRGEATRGMTYAEGLLDDKPVCDWQEDLQNAVDDYNMVRSMRKSGEAPKSLARVKEIASQAPVEVARVFADVDTIGGDFIPTVLLPRLERELVLSRRLAANFQTVPMNNKNEILDSAEKV